MTEQTAIANYLKYTGKKSFNFTTALIDMDGVLFDSMKNHTRAWVKLMKKNGIKYDEVQRMVKHEQEKYGWEFLFLGANMDAISAARSFGIRPDRAVRFQNDGAGTELNYEVVSEAVSCVRRRRAIAKDWSRPIAEDYRRRGGRD